MKKYVDNGTLRIEWRNFPIFGAESEAAARGAWAAGQQGKFWQFHAAAYAEGAKEKGFGADRLKELAKEAGVPDAGRFATDLDSDAAKAAVKKDQDEAYGLSTTPPPSFLINGTPIAGAQPMDAFAQAIEAAAKAEKMTPDIGYLAAFLGSLLALLSPCSALLLPAFFAYSISSRTKLLARTGIFYAGLATTLVPLGAAGSYAGGSSTATGTSSSSSAAG